MRAWLRQSRRWMPRCGCRGSDQGILERPWLPCEPSTNGCCLSREPSYRRRARAGDRQGRHSARDHRATRDRGVGIRGTRASTRTVAARARQTGLPRLLLAERRCRSRGRWPRKIPRAIERTRRRRIGRHHREGAGERASATDSGVRPMGLVGDLAETPARASSHRDGRAASPSAACVPRRLTGFGSGVPLGGQLMRRRQPSLPEATDSSPLTRYVASNAIRASGS